MSKMREKESLECVRMHIWALKNQKLLGPLSGPWTPAAYCSLRSHDSASLRRQLSAAEAGAPLDQILDPHLHWQQKMCPHRHGCHLVITLIDPYVIVVGIVDALSMVSTKLIFPWKEHGLCMIGRAIKVAWSVQKFGSWTSSITISERWID